MSETILTKPAPPPDHRLTYGHEPCQFADLRLPSNQGPHPCVIVIHGGFWRARYDLEHIGHLCQALTAAGFATWSIEYRRVGTPGGGWLGTFRDVVQAAGHLFALAPPYHIDADRVMVIGHSAGGHLALWLAGLRTVPTESAIAATPLPLRAVVSLAGVLDLRQAWALGLGNDAVTELLGGTPADVPDRYAAASPIELLPLDVPQLVLHGTDDSTVPHGMSVAYHAAATARGDDVALLTLPNTGHFELIDPTSRIWTAVFGALISLLDP